MPQNKNASGFPDATTATGVSFLARVAGRWHNVAASLLQPSRRNVTHKTTNYNLLASESGGIFTNYGASAAMSYNLPAAVEGLHYTFVVRATQQLQVDPNGSETIGAGTGGQYYWADAINETLTVVCAETGKWTVTSSIGTWTFV